MQPWKFLVVRSKKERTALSKAAHDQTFLIEAPIVIVICADAERSASQYGSRGRELYVFQDTAAATENLLIAATALGYGSCWVGAFDEDDVSRALSISDRLRPVAMVPIGKSAEAPRPPRRRAMRDIVEMR
jgi:SagB-type dehydrogenase family enzyme